MNTLILIESVCVCVCACWKTDCILCAFRQSNGTFACVSVFWDMVVCCCFYADMLTCVFVHVLRFHEVFSFKVSWDLKPYRPTPPPPQHNPCCVWASSLHGYSHLQYIFTFLHKSLFIIHANCIPCLLASFEINRTKRVFAGANEARVVTH